MTNSPGLPLEQTQPGYWWKASAQPLAALERAKILSAFQYRIRIYPRIMLKRNFETN